MKYISFIFLLTLSMKKIISPPNLSLLNFGVVFYFVGLYVINTYKVDLVLIGVFIELLTLPFMLAMVLFLVFSIIYIVKEKSKQVLLFVSIFLLALCAFFTIGSFF